MKNRTMARKLERARVQAGEAAAIERRCLSLGREQSWFRLAVQFGAVVDRRFLSRCSYFPTGSASASWGVPIPHQADYAVIARTDFDPNRKSSGHLP
jgi:hypothetical protein